MDDKIVPSPKPVKGIPKENKIGGRMVPNKAKIGPHFRKIFRSWVKILSAAIAMGAVAYFSNKFLLPKLGESIALILSIGVGGAVYLAMLPFLKLEEVDNLIELVKEKLGKRN